MHLSGDPITGMLDSESPAMESNGDAFLPVLGQTGEWPLDQVTPESQSSVVANDSTQDVQQQPKAVEQLQYANAQLIQEEHTTPPQPPGEGTEEQAAEPQQQTQPMTLDSDTKDSGEGNVFIYFLTIKL